MAFHNVHSPMQAPDWLVRRQNASLCPTRRTLHAMVEAVDNVTDLILRNLKGSGMYGNSVIAFSADNGGAPGVGSNYPLRGCKSTFFEGGVRSVAFVHSPLLPARAQGDTVDGLMHICDWYATFASLAGYSPGDSAKGAAYPVDAIDMWPLLTGGVSTSPRTEVVVGFNFTHSHPLQGALIVGTHKLIVGLQGYNADDSLSWTPPDFPCSKVKGGPDCDPYCVFDVYADPREMHDLSGNASVLGPLLARYKQLGDEPVDWHDRAGSKPGGRTPDDNKDATCAYMTQRGGFWRPWHNDTTPPSPTPSPRPHPRPAPPHPPAPPVAASNFSGVWSMVGREGWTANVSVDVASGTVAVEVVSCGGCCWDKGTGVVSPLGRTLNMLASSSRCTRRVAGTLIQAPSSPEGSHAAARVAGAHADATTRAITGGNVQRQLMIQWACSKLDGSGCSWPDWTKQL